MFCRPTDDRSTMLRYSTIPRASATVILRPKANTLTHQHTNQNPSENRAMNCPKCGCENLLPHGISTFSVFCPDCGKIWDEGENGVLYNASRGRRPPLDRTIVTKSGDVFSISQQALDELQQCRRADDVDEIFTRFADHICKDNRPDVWVACGPMPTNHSPLR